MDDVRKLGLFSKKALSRPTWFPKSKFVLMIRDPRAIASSLKKRKITIGSVDNQGSSFYQNLLSAEFKIFCLKGFFVFPKNAEMIDKTTCRFSIAGTRT